MAIDNLALQIITDDLKAEMTSAYFDKPFALGPNQFAFPYHSGHSEENKGRGTFIISMDPSNPYISYSLDKFAKVTLTTPFFNTLKRLGGTQIKRISKVEGERIILIETQISAQTLDTVDSGYDLVIELFPQRPNIYFIPQPYNKVSALYKESGDVFSDRYIARGLSYLPPMKRTPLSKDTESEEEAMKYLSRSTGKLFEEYSALHGFKESLSALLDSKHLYLIDGIVEPFDFGRKDALPLQTKDIYSSYVTNQKELAKKMSYSALSETVKKLIAIAKKKKKHLEADLSAASARLDYKDYGQELFLHQTEYVRGMDHMDVDNFHILLDKKKDAVQNANDYFKKYRKAKSAYQTLGPLIEKSQAEISYLESKLLEISKGGNEDILELKQELAEEGYLRDKNNNPIKAKHSGRQIVPHYLKSDTYKIGFGLNAYQNEELTFKIATNEAIFLHVKDHPGSHVVILAGDSPETRLLAAELSLYLSEMEEGDVMVAPVRKVKKNKEKRGLVNVLEYKLITLHTLRSSSVAMFEKLLKE
jgi:predicted ribosome quality control (RQC) complex YloA/Tae2 family protein